MKIQTSWKAAASDTSVHRGTCMLDFKNIPCRIKIPTRKIRTVSQIPNLSFFFILFMLSTRIKLLQVHLGREVWGGALPSRPVPPRPAQPQACPRQGAPRPAQRPSLKPTRARRAPCAPLAARASAPPDPLVCIPRELSKLLSPVTPHQVSSGEQCYLLSKSRSCRDSCGPRKMSFHDRSHRRSWLERFYMLALLERMASKTSSRRKRRSCCCHGVCIGFLRPEAQSQETEIEHEIMK